LSDIVFGSAPEYNDEHLSYPVSAGLPELDLVLGETPPLIGASSAPSGIALNLLGDIESGTPAHLHHDLN
jgi:hypothetical protein